MLVLFTILYGGQTAAARYDLSATPSKCVALQKGQVCYARIRIIWQTTEQGDYCLWSANANKPLRCWRDKSSGDYYLEFADSEDLEIVLKYESSETVLATTAVSVAWVYRQRIRNRRSWRIF